MPARRTLSSLARRQGVQHLPLDHLRDGLPGLEVRVHRHQGIWPEAPTRIEARDLVADVLGPDGRKAAGEPLVVVDEASIEIENVQPASPPTGDLNWILSGADSWEQGVRRCPAPVPAQDPAHGTFKIVLTALSRLLSWYRAGHIS